MVPQWTRENALVICSLAAIFLCTIAIYEMICNDLNRSAELHDQGKQRQNLPFASPWSNNYLD